MMDEMQETGYAARGVFLAPFLNAEGTPLMQVVDSRGRRIKEEPLDGAPCGAASFAQVETLWLFLYIHDPRAPLAAPLFPVSSKPTVC
jgi:hypothetical protein